MGDDWEEASLGGEACAVNPGEIVLYTDVVDEVTGLKVISSVEDELGIVAEGGDVGGIGVGDDGVDVDVAVDAAELAGCGDRLGELVRDVLFVEEDLALEVAELDEVAVDETEVADPGADEDVGEDGSEGAGADDGDACRAEASLAVVADGVESCLAVVARVAVAG